MIKTRNNCEMESEKKMAFKVLKVIGFVILGIAVCILLGFVIMWLWNWLMPQIFGLGVITYWQAVGIFILGKIIFGSIGGSDNSNKKHKGGIRKEIGKEIKKEFDKEFDKEYKKTHEEGTDENEDYDEMYEKWWDTKGEKDFQSYMNDEKDSD